MLHSNGVLLLLELLSLMLLLLGVVLSLCLCHGGGLLRPALLLILHLLLVLHLLLKVWWEINEGWLPHLSSLGSHCRHLLLLLAHVCHLVLEIHAHAA